MKLSVVSGALGAMTLDESLAYLKDLGVSEFELGVGGYPGTKHADAKILSVDKAAREELVATFKSTCAYFGNACALKCNACERIAIVKSLVGNCNS